MGLAIILLVTLHIASFLTEKNRSVSLIRIANSVLFIFLCAVYPFAVESDICREVLSKWIGEYNYEFLHYGFSHPLDDYLGIGFSALFVVELVSILAFSLASIFACIKTFKVLRKTIKLPKANFRTFVPFTFKNNGWHEENESSTSVSYLKLCQLRL